MSGPLTNTRHGRAKITSPPLWSPWKRRFSIRNFGEKVQRTHRKRGRYGKRGREGGCEEGHRTTENRAGNAGGDPSRGGGNVISDPSRGGGNGGSDPGRPADHHRRR